MLLSMRGPPSAGRCLGSLGRPTSHCPLPWRHFHSGGTWGTAYRNKFTRFLPQFQIPIHCPQVIVEPCSILFTNAMKFCEDRISFHGLIPPSALRGYTSPAVH